MIVDLQIINQQSSFIDPSAIAAIADPENRHDR
jgi:hypothetical protein